MLILFAMPSAVINFRLQVCFSALSGNLNSLNLELDTQSFNLLTDSDFRREGTPLPKLIDLICFQNCFLITWKIAFLISKAPLEQI